MDSARAAVAEAIRQALEGEDFTPPASLLRHITSEKAAEHLPWMPYSILTNVAHADFWQRIWLSRLQGKKARSFIEDWRTPPSQDWPSVREGWLNGMDEALAIASEEPFEHRMKSDEAALKTLLQIAVHNAYHTGQINLLKRELRLHARLPEEED